MTDQNDKAVTEDATETGHFHLVHLINRLSGPDHGDESLGEALESLLAYAAKRFLAEEERLLAHAPELFERHLPLHNAFIEKAYEFIQAFNDGERDGLAARLHAFVSQWLTEKDALATQGMPA